MRKEFDNFTESGRILTGEFRSSPKNRYGAFVLRCPFTNERLTIIVVDSDTFAREGRSETAWDHVSVSTQRRCPTWEEMCWVKDLFFEDTECVVQYHPEKKDYVNEHEYVLHLWRCPSVPFPMPPKVCV